MSDIRKYIEECNGICFDCERFTECREFARTIANIRKYEKEDELYAKNYGN